VPLHQLAITPADVSGHNLGLALNAPAPAPLAACRLEHPDGGALRLGVLGASHVVVVEHAGRRFCEQVSCAARGLGGDLPARSEAPGYHLQSRTDSYDEPTFRRIAGDLRQRCADGHDWLGGTFPGDDAALTALAAEPDGAGWRWQTWHLYPAPPGGSVVYTTSRWRP
jgi:Protein of unknown function DUF2617